MSTAATVASSSAGLPPNSYIYKLISTAPRQDPLTYSKLDQLAIISSDDSLRFLDPSTLAVNATVDNVNEKVTCLERANDVPSNVVATAGRDGAIRFWDKRTRQKALEIEAPHKLISALVCDAPNHFIAAGVENPDDGLCMSPVYIWDQRNPSTPTLSLVESHTDTITSLHLHPNHPTLLLSSSTDGLINIFDTSQPEEEDALYQVINHGSAIAHAGFMYPSTDIYALGTNETMSFHPLQSQKEDEEEPTPQILGDVRDTLDCEYLVDMHWIDTQPFIAVGKHSKSHMNLIPITSSSPVLSYNFSLDKTIHFPHAHDAEIIRHLFTCSQARTTYTCGEDGYVRAWRLEAERMEIDADEDNAEAKRKSADKKERRKEKRDRRFKPY